MIASTVHPGDADGLVLAVEVFPDGRPVPPLLTPLEVVKLLRLDILTRPGGAEEQREPADALKSLDHIVAKGRLRPRRFGKSRTYSRDECLHLIASGGGEA